MTASPRLLCLLPVRNGEHDLPAYLESVSRFADGVVALDDGSIDGTFDLLVGHDLVVETLRNPRRESYAGWDDAANRQALLDAAADADADWVMWLDVDERISADDAPALRAFVESDALPGFAYGFRVHRMLEELDRYDRADLWVYRLFAYEPGLRLPQRSLHLVPVPTSIPRTRWAKTTLRIQHLGGSTEERRLARMAKYREADPENRFQRSYEHLTTAGAPMPWLPRAPDAPVLLEGPAAIPDDLDGPTLSAIVIARHDEERIEAVVESVVSQECDEPFEVILVTSGGDRTAEIVRARFPDVTVVELEGRAYPGRARNAGLAVARGEFVSFPGSHVTLVPGSLQARIDAHRAGWPMVTGTTVNGNDTRAGWAAYFLDHSSVLPGRPSVELTGPPAHCSYFRDALQLAGGFPEDMRAGEDTVVNVALFRRGYRAYRDSRIRLVHASPCRSGRALAVHHFRRGRALGRILLQESSIFGPVFARRNLKRLLSVRFRLERTRANVERWGGGLIETYDRVGTLVRLGAAAAWAGAMFELLRPQRGKLRKLFAGRTRGRAKTATTVAGANSSARDGSLPNAAARIERAGATSRL